MANPSSLRFARLPNGVEVAYQSRAELRQFYEDIFEKRVYTRAGITLRGGDCVFDVGANIGLFTIFVAQQIANARILAFEPAPPLFEILTTNTAWCGGEVQLFACGLSSRRGHAELTFYPHSSGMSSFYADERQEKAALRTLMRNELAHRRPGVEEVMRYEEELLERRFEREVWSCPLRTLSDVVREHGIDRIDLLKVDVEKSEADVLAGIAERDWKKIRQMALEVHDLGDRLRDLTSLVRSHGFAVSLEQDELYAGSDRYNLYARREAAV